MPELPEVETVVRTLERQIAGEKILSVTVRCPKMIECGISSFTEQLTGQSFRGFSRRGKYLLFTMDDCILVCHLRMEGKFYIQNDDEPLSRHVHVIFQLENGRQLRYHDTRQFGRMTVLPKTYDFTNFHDLGPEPFDGEFNTDYIKCYIKNRRIPVKSLLLEQSFTAGIGNIYADEILFAAKVRPGRSCARVTVKEWQAIIDSSRDILSKAVAAGGTTIRSYTSSLGVTGLFQLDCMVHTKKKCRICGSDIKMKRIGSRSSYYCPKCQK
ncbi:MAG: DNA-formamidopyrimidine glycosylase [Solobacterium sp.]|nr:DNA-formamidopyrimidine glycosylase [Solobacterium sp.]